MGKIIHATYYGDEFGNTEQETKDIASILEANNIDIDLYTWDILKEGGDPLRFLRHWDILFYDWGGMSFGNSLMDNYCRYMLHVASDNPSKLFVMTSEYTKNAMQSALEELPQGQEKLNNIFLGVHEFIKFYKEIKDDETI